MFSGEMLVDELRPHLKHEAEGQYAVANEPDLYLEPLRVQVSGASLATIGRSLYIEVQLENGTID